MDSMNSSLIEEKCKNCDIYFKGSYCNNCGQKAIHERYTLKHLFNLTLDSFNLQKGFFFTVKMLLTNPGKVINGYLEGRSKDFYNPLKYLILIASINAVLMLWFGIFETNIEATNELLGEAPEGNNFQQLIAGYVRTYLNIFALLILPFYSLVSKWVFKKFKLYYAEHLIVNGYLFAQYTLLQMVTYLLFSFIPSFSKLSMAFSIVVFITYYTYAFIAIFKIRFFKSLVSAAVIYLLGFILFMFFIILILAIAVFVIHLSGFDLKELVQ